jgi:hypothetical protein
MVSYIINVSESRRSVPPLPNSPAMRGPMDAGLPIPRRIVLERGRPGRMPDDDSSSKSLLEKKKTQKGLDTDATDG